MPCRCTREHRRFRSPQISPVQDQHNSVARFLEAKGMVSTALQVATELVVRVCCVGEAFSLPMLAGSRSAASHPVTRAVLDRYAAAGGRYTEVVLDAGHSPQVEKAAEFQAALAEHLAGA